MQRPIWFLILMILQDLLYAITVRMLDTLKEVAKHFQVELCLMTSCLENLNTQKNIQNKKMTFCLNHLKRRNNHER